MTLRPHFGVPETTSRPLRRYVLPASSTGVNFAAKHFTRLHALHASARSNAIWRRIMNPTKKSSRPEHGQSDRLLTSFHPVIFRPEIPTCWPWMNSHTGSGSANKPFIRWPPKAMFALSASVSVFRISVGRSLSTRTEEIPRVTLFRTMFIAVSLLLRVSPIRAIVSPGRLPFRPQWPKLRNPDPPFPNPAYSASHRRYRPIIFPCRMRFGNTASQQQTSVWN